ncbi:MAG: sigma-70 family RNA polymerase sigma factor [Ruminococcus sp.]|nr:sigma-70 family RNA polymerase sigma factor [Ruminococcus sp.]
MMLLFYLSLVDTLSDKEKVEKIYTAYYGLMLHVAEKYLERKSDREDVVHDSMIKIIRNIDKVDVFDEFRAKSFCATVVKHTAIDFLRKKENKAVDFDEEINLENAQIDPLDIMLVNESYNAIIRAIDNLSDIYKSVCKLKYINGLKEREIAQILDLPVKTVSVRIFRGKQILREAIKRGEDDGR